MDNSEDHDMKNSERNEQNEMKLQAQLVASVLPEYDIIELPGRSTTASSPSSAMSGSCTSATSLNSSSSASSLIANLREVDTTMKLGCRPTSAASNLMSTNFPADLRRTQYDQTDSEHVAIPKICAGVNCPEKLVLCLDLSSEMERMKFLSRAGDRFSTLQLVKRTIGLFVQSKHRLDNHHRFAFVTLHDTATWYHSFTNDPREIANLLENLDETYKCSNLDVGSVLKTILRNCELPIMEDPTLPPPYIVRIILIFGRSQSKLDICEEVQKLLLLSPFLFVDVFYVHEPPSEDNCCEQIFDQLCSLDVKGQSYIFEVSKNLTKLYDSMAQLLAHPLQRPLQRDSSHRIRANMEEG
ncbi:BRISC and BRCA1-A complex member 1 [Octopus bimaculoides]|uniref:BRISC and BRCA1-A complex member 1 n=1 Tax=Octopus bimaculoides TaxID=37653 RepID=A0A0L8H8J2_OCTBM|nr:BRISC and BRCA1-A complex member 1 [Octopus bimaculoides]|eukprot:XP_014774637.1 PREDICTED: BRISC and BRCA1-A complex member 1-like [Octopus bimaculoides]